MAYQELSEYVAAQIGRDVDAHAIRQTLMGAGWRSIDVDNALRDAAAHSMPAIGVSVHDDLLRIRHAVNTLEERMGHIETRLAINTQEPIGEVTAKKSVPAPRPLSGRRYLVLFGLVTVFALFGYTGMRSIVTEAVTPLSRIWAGLAIGLVLVVPGFVAGRVGRRGVANLLTATGLAFAALATVNAWYVHFIGSGVAVSLGVLLLTVALVLGRFYDLWVLRPTVVPSA